jgi:RecB family exonuclease
MPATHAGETPASHSGLLVVDYKTGRLPSEADIDEGRNLQLPLYAAAAEQILGRPSLGGVFHHVGEDPRMRFFAAFKFARKKYSACEDYPQRQAAAMAKAQEFIDSMAGGRFDLLPKKKCPTWCPYRRICHFSPARLPLKSPPPADTAQTGGPRMEGQT